MKYYQVKTKQVKKGSKGLTNRSAYVMDGDHPEHADTEIITLRSYGKAQYYIEQNIQARKEERQKEGLRGGGIQNYATEFSLNLPPGAELSKKQWETLRIQIVKRVAKRAGIDANDLNAVCGAVVHHETGSKHDHCHLILGNIVGNKHIKDITQHRTKHIIQQTFTKFLFNELGLDATKHVPKPENAGKNKPLWKARAEKSQSILDKVEEIQEKMDKVNKRMDKVINNMDRQNRTIMEAIENGDQKKVDKFTKRVAKSNIEWNELKEERDILKKNMADVPGSSAGEAIRKRKQDRAVRGSVSRSTPFDTRSRPSPFDPV